MVDPHLHEFRALAVSGPLFSTLKDVDWTRWALAAEKLERLLPDEPSRTRRVHQLCVPLLFWLVQVAKRPAGGAGARLVGLSGPQGCGKSTLTRQLLPLLADLGVRAVTVSIDDFYLTHAEQERVTAAHPGNRYLAHRGYPGTHDVPLGVTILDGLRGLVSGGAVSVPSYDKSAHGGRGDRRPEAEWPVTSGPLDLVILEGWMVGFRPVAESRIADPSMRVVNRLLALYEAWHSRIDTFALLRTADPENVVRWRVGAEAARAASGEPALDRATVLDYIQRFLPAYALYADTVGAAVQVWLGSDRAPVVAR